MNVTVYIDVFIVQNLIINYFLLMISCKILRKKIFFWRCLAGSSLGVIYGVSALLVKNTFFSGILIKGIVAFFMVVIVLYRKNEKIFDAVKSWGVFILSSFVLCGVAVFIHISVSKGTIFRGMILNASFKNTMVSLFLVFIFLERLFYYVNSKRVQKSYVFECEVHRGDKKYFFTGLLDTGNFLAEPISGKDVAIISVDILEYFDLRKEDCYRVPYTCVGNTTEFLFAFEPDAFILKNHKGEKMILNRILVGYSGQKFREDFNGILPANVLVQMK